MPPSISRGGAGACATNSPHAQAYLGRRVTITRKTAGGSSRSDLSSPMTGHGLAAAGADRALRFDDLLDPLQMRRQRAPVCAPFLRAGAFKAFVFLLVFRFGLGVGCFQLFQNQSELIFAQALGFAAEARPPQHGDEVVKLFVSGVEFVALFR